MFVFLRIWPEKIRQLKVSYIWFDKWLVVWLVGSQSFSYERCLCAVTSCYVRIVQMSQDITDQPMWTWHCSCVAEINCVIRAVKWATHVSLTLANARQLYAKTLESLNERIHHPFALTLTTFNPNSLNVVNRTLYTTLLPATACQTVVCLFIFSIHCRYVIPHIYRSHSGCVWCVGAFAMIRFEIVPIENLTMR